MIDRRHIELILTLCLLPVFHCFGQPENSNTTASGLQYQILSQGEGEKARSGDNVKVAETVTYRDGTEVYSTEGQDNLPVFMIGGGQAIKGVDEGVRGMRIGEVRKLVVPPSLSKRTRYPKFLSPDSTLIYTIKLVEIVRN